MPNNDPLTQSLDKFVHTPGPVKEEVGVACCTDSDFAIQGLRLMTLEAFLQTHQLRTSAAPNSSLELDGTPPTWANLYTIGKCLNPPGTHRTKHSRGENYILKD
ncbi:hypothetical protein E8E12_001659 [Didymella heteroderae]|uniref:Uncharacterized protein n=1 Tax=Didymella heteroderae TaxID=1769908 RepID=A0A9P4WG94_9PLEO|nr:hypothetical protein E8E12_001659 [Didymella heteroderae]